MSAEPRDPAAALAVALAASIDADVLVRRVFGDATQHRCASSIFRVVAEAILHRAALNGYAERLESWLARNECVG